MLSFFFAWIFRGFSWLFNSKALKTSGCNYRLHLLDSRFDEQVHSSCIQIDQQNNKASFIDYKYYLQVRRISEQFTNIPYLP